MYMNGFEKCSVYLKESLLLSSQRQLFPGFYLGRQPGVTADLWSFSLPLPGSWGGRDPGSAWVLPLTSSVDLGKFLNCQNSLFSFVKWGQ